ncbi:hypothetical protein V6N13_072050 [Hibiscus sabdariffa]
MGTCNGFTRIGNLLYSARRSALELYQGPVQIDHDNNVAVVLPVPLLGVDKGHKQRLLPVEGPSTEPLTMIPSIFSHSSSSQFHFTMEPLTEGFFAEAFQPYSSMMSVPSDASG